MSENRIAPEGPKILLISYHFPPDASVGAIRPAKFAKYLSRLGWRPYVLTVKERHLPAIDSGRLDEVRDLPIVRTACWPTLLQLAVGLKRRLRASAARSAASTSPIPDSVSGNGDGRGPMFHIKRYLSSVFELPDKQVGWLIPALWTAYRLIRTEGIRTVIISSPPRTTALIGLLLSYLAPVRVVTDLRDPWFTPYFRQGFYVSLKDVAAGRSAIGDAVERWLEKKILQRSARVVTTTEHLALALRQFYASTADGRLAVIPNGYDAEDFRALQPVQPPRRFNISYVGSLYLDQTVKPFLEAVRELVREGRLSPSEVEINLIGPKCAWTKDGLLDDFVAASGLGDCVSIEEPVPYKESLLRMMQAHVLLLVCPERYCSIPAKTFDYLATRRPILCIADDGATAELIRDTGAGVVVPPADRDAIKAALSKLFDAFKAGQHLANEMDVSRFERRALSERLSNLLAEIA
jgi:glycosyltransferase involved in cell wall biosynthesis